MAVTPLNPQTLARKDQPVVVNPVIVLTTTRRLRASESGARVVLNSATAFTTTLPPPAKGLEFFFIVKLVGAATGHIVAVGSGVLTKMFGKVRTTASVLLYNGVAGGATASKGRTLTGATGIVGDSLYVWSDGTDWFSESDGVWVEQA